MVRDNRSAHWSEFGVPCISVDRNHFSISSSCYHPLYIQNAKHNDLSSLHDSHWQNYPLETKNINGRSWALYGSLANIAKVSGISPQYQYGSGESPQAAFVIFFYLSFQFRSVFPFGVVTPWHGLTVGMGKLRCQPVHSSCPSTWATHVHRHRQPSDHNQKDQVMPRPPR